ncbi:MAG: tetratricopeptide repeat protein [Candidatus Obscuribacterales bacterium]
MNLLTSAAGTGISLLENRAKIQEEELNAKRTEMATVVHFNSGRNLSAEQVAELEKVLEADQNDLKARCLLVGYFGRANRDQSDEEKYEAHALWVIENLPSHRLARLCELAPRLDSQESYDKGKQLWLRHLEEKPRNLQIMQNASDFFLLADEDIAESILINARKIEPHNPLWSESLAHLYDLKSRQDASAAPKALKEQEHAYSLYKSKSDRLDRLADLAELAFHAKEFEKASKYAQQRLKAQNRRGTTQCNDASHKCHTILGRLALRNGKLEEAKRHILKSGAVTGSAVLNSFGPGFDLAKELLEKGEREVVLEYLALCERFWKPRDNLLYEWREQINAGAMPGQWEQLGN